MSHVRLRWLDNLWRWILIDDAGATVVDTSVPGEPGVEVEVNDFIPAGASDAASVAYDNGTSGLSATDVQAAVDEVVANPVAAGLAAVLGVSNDPGPTNIQAAAASAFVEGGSVSVSPAAEGTGGTAQLQGGQGTGSGGGQVALEGGVTGVSGGAATLRGGNGNTGLPGAAAVLVGGDGDDGEDPAAYVKAHPGSGAGAPGRLEAKTANSTGNSGQSLNPDGAGKLVYGGIPSAAGVPSGAPDGLPPFAYDSTAVSGGFYFWNGSAWVKVATIL